MILVKGLQRYQRLKLEVEKNICQLGWPCAHGFEPGWSADIFLASNFDLWHMRDLLHICLETKGQGVWITFKVSNLGSKHFYFKRAYLVRVCTFFVTAVFNTYYGSLESFYLTGFFEGYFLRLLLVMWDLLNVLSCFLCKEWKKECSKNISAVSIKE